ncbi:hypothetical protein ACH4E7_40345 [Kitasatospora sp. NPDC018058]|uniref:hypothetical protein n=1 Tax=Kitasatospora sp. NPDC018058 TaxID=3364025 RepID=UPI0037C15E41
MPCFSAPPGGSCGIWFCRDSKNDRATRDAVVDLEAAGRVRQELRLPDNRKLWTLTAAGTKLAALRPERDGASAAFSEHALDVVATAGPLARAGIGHLGAFTTEVEHSIPHCRSLFTDLVLRDPGAKPLTSEEREEKAKADHCRLVRRLAGVEVASKASWYTPAYGGDAVHARDYHRALPVVATTCRCCADSAPTPRSGTGSVGAAGTPSLRRWPTRTATGCCARSRSPLMRPARPGRRRSASGARPACTRCRPSSVPASEPRAARQDRGDVGREMNALPCALERQ